jgi:putative transposase
LGTFHLPNIGGGDDAMLAESHRVANREHELWQCRLWENLICDDRDFANQAAHIHINPVKHGYVQHAAAPPHSITHQFVRRGDFNASWGASVRDGEYGGA